MPALFYSGLYLYFVGAIGGLFSAIAPNHRLQLRMRNSESQQQKKRKN
jgi:hypothetical protein